MGRVHQREADVVLAHEVAVARLRRARVQLHQRAAAEVEPPAAAHRADAVQLPAVANAPRSTARLSASTPTSNMLRAACGSGRA